MLRTGKWWWRPCSRCGESFKVSKGVSGEKKELLPSGKGVKGKRRRLCDKCNRSNMNSLGFMKKHGGNKIIVLPEPDKHTIEGLRRSISIDKKEQKEISEIYLRKRQWIKNKIYRHNHPNIKHNKHNRYKSKIFYDAALKKENPKEHARLYAIEYRRKNKKKCNDYYKEYYKKNKMKEINRIQNYYRRRRIEK